MNVLYLTYDIILEEPIVISQVVEMCNRVTKQNKNITFDIISFKNNNENDKSQLGENENLRFHYVIKSEKFIFDYFRYFMKSVLLTFQIEYKIVHVRSYIPMPIALFLKLLFRKKVIFDMRGLLPEEHIYFNGKSKKSLFYIVTKYLEKIFVKYSDHIVVVSNNFRDYLENRYKIHQEISVIYCSANQINNEKITNEKRNHFYSRYLIQSNQILITYVGSFYKYQNIEKLFSKVEKISQLNNIKFLIFTKTDKSIVKEQLKKSGLNPADVIVDYIESNELNKYLAFCDYGVIMRDDDLINKVASPIKISEYISNNLRILFCGEIGDFSALLYKYKCGYNLCNIPVDDVKLIKSEDHDINYELKKLVSFEYNQSIFFNIYKKFDN